MENKKNVQEQTQQQGEDQKRLDPEMITSADIAIRVLMSAVEVAFKKNVYEDMNDVACISKSVKLANEFVGHEVFKYQNLNQLLSEFTDEEGKTTIEKVTPKWTETAIDNIQAAMIGPDVENRVLFMFINGAAIVLNEGDVVYNVFGTFVPVKADQFQTEEVVSQN